MERIDVEIDTGFIGDSPTGATATASARSRAGFIQAVVSASSSGAQRLTGAKVIATVDGPASNTHCRARSSF